MIRKLVAPVMAVAVAAGLVVFADPAIAQPPGFGGKGKGGFDKGKGSDKGGPGGDAVRTLEAELARLKALETEVESKLKQLKSGPGGKGGFEPKGPPPKGKGEFEPKGPPPKGGFEPKGPMGPGGFGPPGGFGWGRGGFGPMGHGGFGPHQGGWGEHARGPESHGGSSHGSSQAVHGIVRAASHLSSAQLKELIGALHKLEAEKSRAAAPAPRTFERPAPRSELRPTPSGRSSNDQILERLDRMAREIEEIRRSLRK
jgi:hypothetical protein